MTMVENVRNGLLIGASPRGEEGREPWFLDPREILRTVGLRWITVLLPVLLLLGLAAAWTHLNPPQYAASTQILIDPRGLQVVKDGLTPPDQASDASLLLVDSQLRVLTSDDVLGRVVDRFDLAKDPEFQGRETLIGALKGLIARFTGRTEPPADPRLTALRILRDRTGARRLERSFVLELGVTSEDREKAARLARGVAETYLARDAATRSDTTRRAGEAIEGRLAELRDALRQAEDKAQAFRARRNLVGTKAADADRGLPPQVQWKAHNYNHLMEQPTLFYAICTVIALSGTGKGVNAAIAWAYVGLRVIHSLVQATTNKVGPRFMLFIASSLALAALTLHAVMAVF